MGEVTTLPVQDIMLALPEPPEPKAQEMIYLEPFHMECTMLYISFARPLLMPAGVTNIHFGANVLEQTATRRLLRQRLACQLPHGKLFQFVWRLTILDGVFWGVLDKGMLQIGIHPAADAGEVTRNVYDIVRTYYKPRSCEPKAKVKISR